jgi:hypothetical protein
MIGGGKAPRFVIDGATPAEGAGRSGRLGKAWLLGEPPSPFMRAGYPRLMHVPDPIREHLMTTAVVLSGGLTGASMVENGLTYYLWGFTVNIDGQVYWCGVWVSGPNANNPDSYSQVAEAVVEGLESDDPEQGYDGIAQADDTGDWGVDGPLDDFGDDDGALAGLGGDSYGDSA